MSRKFCELRRAAVVGLICAVGACKGKGPERFMTAAVVQGTVRETVTATGSISARVKVNVGSQVSGTINKINVDFNSHVRKGDVLAEIDARLFEAQLARYEASVAVAQADLKKSKVTLSDAERTLRRYTELAKDHMAAQSDLDAAQVAHDAADAAVLGSEALLQQSLADRNQYTTNLALTKIRSPIDGTVIDRQVDVGQTVAAQFQVATLFTIANSMQSIQVIASIDESDVGKVHAGMPVTFAVDAYPEESFKGVVRTIRPAPSSTTTSSSTTSTSSSGAASNVVTYDAVVDAQNPEEKLRQGMTAEVSMVVQSHENVLCLPTSALRYRPANPPPADRSPTADSSPSVNPPKSDRRRTTVFRLVNDKPERVEIHLGISDGHNVEVLDGLNQSDNVIVGDLGRSGGSSRGPF